MTAQRQKSPERREPIEADRKRVAVTVDDFARLVEGQPLAGEPTPVFPAAADEVATFRSLDDCPSTSTTYFDQGNAHCNHWGPCADGSEVIFCTIDQGGHAWPGGSGLFSESSPLDATSQIWAFLKRHTLP